MTKAEVRKTGKPALFSTMAMKNVMRAYERGETEGFMKILVDRNSKQILGASLLGLEGDEVIHCVLDISQGALHGDTTRDAHSSHGVGIYSDSDGSAQAAAMSGAVPSRGETRLDQRGPP
jgi:pyruvate/2-oxoglutarate dehydrogenase complex dihydrolipoamide dehydrogenase (E3) component